MRGFGWLHRTCKTESDELARKLATVRATHARTRKERDRALDLLRAVRLAGGVPAELVPHVNGLVALESEGDIEDARNRAADLLAAAGWVR